MEGDGASELTMENLSYPERMEGESTATVTFTLRNAGDRIIEDLVIRAMPKDLSGMLSKSVSVLKEPTLLPGESKRYSFSFASTPATATGNYPILLSVTGKGGDGSELSKLEQYVAIFVKGADGTKAAKSVPRLVIEKFSMEPEVANAGENCTIHLRFKNTHPSPKYSKSPRLPPISEGATAERSRGESIFIPSRRQCGRLSYRLDPSAGSGGKKSRALHDSRNRRTDLFRRRRL